MTILRRFWRQMRQNFHLRNYTRTLTCITVPNSGTVRIRRQKYHKLQTKILEVLRIAINRNNIIDNQLTSHDAPSGIFREWWSDVRLNPVIQDFVTSIRNNARVSNTIYWCVYTGSGRKTWRFLSYNKMKSILSFYVNLLLKLSLSQSILITIFTSW